MPDSRNVAHAKKVIEEKKHQHEDPEAETLHAIQPGKKPKLEKHTDHEDPATARADEAEEKAHANVAEVPAPRSIP